MRMGFAEKTCHLCGHDTDGKNLTVIQCYNEHMGAVDIIDQLLDPNNPTRKSTACQE